LYEAGALAKTNGIPCTLLLGLTPREVPEPLAQFQHTLPNHKDMRRLLGTINDSLSAVNERPLTTTLLDSAFDKYWPELDGKLQELIKRPDAAPRAHPSTDETVEKILDISRRVEQMLAKAEERETRGFLERQVRQTGQIPLSAAGDLIANTSYARIGSIIGDAQTPSPGTSLGDLMGLGTKKKSA
jgi:hypothetical protein